MALNFQPEIIDGRNLQRNQVAVAAHIDDSYYKRYLPAGMFLPFTNAGATSERYDYWIFPDANSSLRVVANTYVPRLWVSGNVEATIFFSGDTASTNPIRWQWIGTSTAIGGSIAVSDVTVAADVPGPTAANLLQRYTFTSYMPIAGDDLLMGCRVLRDGTHANDTYGGEAWFIGLLLRFIPAKQELDVTGRVP